MIASTTIKRHKRSGRDYLAGAWIRTSRPQIRRMVAELRTARVLLGELEVLDVRREPLAAINNEPQGTAREGFPELLPHEFVHLFRKAMGCEPEDMVTRIEFRRVLP